MSSAGDYASWHNPALYYRNLRASACRHRDLPYPKHLPRYLPRFVFAVRLRVVDAFHHREGECLRRRFVAISTR